jgi:hypothetical protein
MECGSGEWLARAHPYADLVRIWRGGRRVADLANYYPIAAVWAGASLLTLTGDGQVLVFPDFAVHLGAL